MMYTALGYETLCIVELLLIMGMVVALIVFTMRTNSSVSFTSFIFSIFIITCTTQFFVCVNGYYASNTIEYRNGYFDYPNGTLYNQVDIIVHNSSLGNQDFLLYRNGFESAQYHESNESKKSKPQQFINTLDVAIKSMRMSTDESGINRSIVRQQVSRT